MLTNPALRACQFRHLVGRGRQVPVATPETIAAWRGMLNRHPDRFLFGTDEVAPQDRRLLQGLRHVRAALRELTPEASQKVRKGNYERLFDEGAAGCGPGKGKANVTHAQPLDNILLHAVRTW